MSSNRGARDSGTTPAAVISTATAAPSPDSLKECWWVVDMRRPQEASTLLVLSCGKAYGWISSYAQRILKSYRQFLELKQIMEDWNSTLLVPARPVELMWREHVSHTQHYFDACSLLFGRLINHIPDQEMDQVARKIRIQTTQTALKARFGKRAIDQEVWTFESLTIGCAVARKQHQKVPHLSKAPSKRKRAPADSLNKLSFAHASAASMTSTEETLNKNGKLRIRIQANTVAPDPLMVSSIGSVTQPRPRKRVTEAGLIAPRCPPLQLEDGSFARPPGRAPTDCYWDTAKGMYAPNIAPEVFLKRTDEGKSSFTGTPLENDNMAASSKPRGSVGMSQAAEATRVFDLAMQTETLDTSSVFPKRRLRLSLKRPFHSTTLERNVGKKGTTKNEKSRLEKKSRTTGQFEEIDVVDLSNKSDLAVLNTHSYKRRHRLPPIRFRDTNPVEDAPRHVLMNDPAIPIDAYKQTSGCLLVSDNAVDTSVTSTESRVVNETSQCVTPLGLEPFDSRREVEPGLSIYKSVSRKGRQASWSDSATARL